MGSIENVCAHPNDSVEAVNFKKGVLSTIHTSIPIHDPQSTGQNNYIIREVIIFRVEPLSLK